MSEVVLKVRSVDVTFRAGARRHVAALRDVDVDLYRGETLAIVGESGSGKSTLAGAILGLTRVEKGSISILGHTVVGQGARRRSARGLIQAVFQDPYSALDPRWSIERSIAEPGRGDAREARVRELLVRVGLDPDAGDRRPTEFSGGQRQRVGIGRALYLAPPIVVCDEAVSALDVSVQAQVLLLLSELQRELGTSYLFITHNMNVVASFASRVVVLYRGRVVETGPVRGVCHSPLHPYTRMLIDSVPVADPDAQRERRKRRLDQRPAPGQGAETDAGCAFAPRCPLATDRCAGERPSLRTVGDRQVACHYGEEIADGAALVE